MFSPKDKHGKKRILFMLSRSKLFSLRGDSTFLNLRERDNPVALNTDLFWNHTCTTLMSSPVSWLSCSLTCLAGLGLLLYASLSVSSCLAVIVVRGLLLGWSPSRHPPSAVNSKVLLSLLILRYP